MTDEFARLLREHLGSLLSGGLAPYEFRRWFASALWAAESSGDEDTLAFADLIEGLLAEHARGDISDDQLIELLRREAESHYGGVPEVPAASLKLHTGASVTGVGEHRTMEARHSFPPLFAGRLLGARSSSAVAHQTGC